MFPEKYNGTMVEKLWNTDRVTALLGVVQFGERGLHVDGFGRQDQDGDEVRGSICTHVRACHI